jgi:hypothetical protein
MSRLKVLASNYLLKHLLNAITEDQILIHNGKKFIVGGKELPEADYRDITSGAQAIKSMYVWQLLCKEMKYHANEDIFNKSQTIDDVMFGKAVLYTVDVMEKKLDKLSKL